MSAKSLVMHAALLSCVLFSSTLIGCPSDEASPGGASGMGGGAMCPAQTPMPINGVPGCEAAVPGTPAQLHADALMNLASATTCGFSSCHNPQRNAAMLDLLSATDLTAFVDKPSCESPGIPVVKSGCGNQALAGSWLWLKLTAPADSSGVLTQDPTWGTMQSCGQGSGQPFGVRMPFSGTADLWGETRLASVRNWICAGAPGPQ